MEQRVINNWKTPGHPTAFAGPKTVYDYYDGRITLKQINEILSEQSTHTRHKPLKRPLEYNSFKTRKVGQQFQTDLIDVGKFQKENDNYKYLLTVIDVFSRHVWVIGLKNKECGNVAEKISLLFDYIGFTPKSIYCDRGGEYTGRPFKDLMRRHNIRLIFSNSNNKAPFIERFQLTLQRLLYQYMHNANTYRYIDALKRLVRSYNSRKHSALDMTPKEAFLAVNRNRVLTFQFNETLKTEARKTRRTRKKFNIGDFVRIREKQGPFSRGYDALNTEEVFKVRCIYRDTPIHTYELTTYNGNENIVGRFYPAELTHSIHQEFPIDQVLERKKIRGVWHRKVTFRGWPRNYFEWIPEAQIRQI